MTESMLWYDLETSGTDAGFDRILQFAAVRTDLNLEPIEAPLNFFCYPGEDVMPDPDAMRVTGLKMSTLQQQGLTEAEFARRIHTAFSVPQTCVVGFNSIRFDDEFVRVLLYRNFYDPYGREWQNGNSRWDTIDLFRMAAALRQDNFNWPTHEDGKPSFRLEHLTAANGVSHESAHDAVADVMATIDVVRLLRAAQPKLYDYLFQLRRKKAVLDQLYPIGKQPVVHVSSMYPASQHCLAVVLPIAVHPTNPNGVICFDLSKDPESLIQCDPTELRRRVFSSGQALGDNEPRIPLKTIHVNRAPAVAPLGTLRGSADRFSIDLEQCERHKQQLQQAAGIVEKIDEAFSAAEFPRTDDPDQMLYQGDFFTKEDREVMLAVQDAHPDQLPAFRGHFHDPRLPEMLLRYQARNYPDSLKPEDLAHWQAFLGHRRASPMSTLRQEKLHNALTAEPQNEILLDLADYYGSQKI